ncbi:lysophospholipid acyltransferase family protein [Acinetobacter indicus]|uniref:lysophospholipid acyltransferase family protein n=1 Tax=Acinetobacter indicus TaxID=756892 RepID=UPI000FD8724F|nr:lysophospholipid acyltransferase family protein [Acinetobacter indicus]MDM1772195.1 lysophospholipid acyltransferase family protein [Acinetobacter indicus]MDM1775094.1 lysophospholipid acyltransferase family protein [Acinetobacter indicus]QIC79860.1 lysophospholipid acyltransferase family protein [Acinetobacter indicus]RVT49261.1 lipid A biosynthesis acyltransferase [Acinetobacter indicus]
MYSLLKNFSKLPLRLIQVTARSVGWLLYVSNSSARRVTEINLRSAYPELSESERDQLTRRSLKSQCMTYAESVKIWGSAPEFALEQIKAVHGEDIFLDALQNPNGTLAVVPHFGTWELMNAWVNLHTAPVIMYKPSKNPDVDRFMLEARQRLNATLVPTDETGVRALFKHLKQGGFAAILPDHVPKESGGIYSPFFGQNALSSTLLSKLAAKTQCSVIGLSCLRREDLSGFELHVQTLSAEINAKDLQLSVDTLNKEMERMINVAPEQYLWGYKRFRKVEGGKNIYHANRI